ncbi:MAG: PqqD family protein [Planctomycetota bacterium]
MTRNADTARVNSDVGEHQQSPAHGFPFDGAITCRGDRKLSYTLPAVESVMLDHDLPTDVQAEWPGARTSNLRPTPAATPPSPLAVTEVRPDPPDDFGGSTDPLDCPRRRSGLCEYPIDDEAIVYDPRTQMLHYLNETAFAIWRACDGRTIRDIASTLARTYDADSGVVLGHASQMVNLLAVGGLLDHEKNHA